MATMNTIMDPLFHNNTVSINDVWYESHKSLLQMICVELGKSDQIEAMVDKFLGKKLKMKAYKDPNKPKRAKSAYFFFCDDERGDIIKKHRAMKNKKINMGNVAKELAVIWKKLTEEKKSKYTASANVDKQRYMDAISIYNEKNGH
jgi:hypothetical protein